MVQRVGGVEEVVLLLAAGFALGVVAALSRPPVRELLQAWREARRFERELRSLREGLAHWWPGVVELSDAELVEHVARVEAALRDVARASSPTAEEAVEALHGLSQALAEYSDVWEDDEELNDWDDWDPAGGLTKS